MKKVEILQLVFLVSNRETRMTGQQDMNKYWI